MSTLPSESPHLLLWTSGGAYHRVSRFNDDDAMLKEADMAMPEERIPGLETKVDDHTRGIGELRESIRSLDAKVDRRFDVLDQKFSHQFTWVIGL